MSDKVKFKPLKDLCLILVSVILVVIIFLLTIFLKPKTNNLHVEIKYDNTLLYEKSDASKNTSIAFPKEGVKKIKFEKSDGKYFLNSKNEFDFLNDSITLTLYSDKSIQIKSTDITCPDHTCSKMGRIYYSYTPIVCLPNKIQLMIVSSSLPEFDA